MRQLHDTDRAIISHLLYDGRMPFMGLSEGTVRRRVKQLTDAGVLQIVGIVEPQFLDCTANRPIPQGHLPDDVPAIDNTDTPLETGLGLAVDFDKPGGFIPRLPCARCMIQGVQESVPEAMRGVSRFLRAFCVGQQHFEH